jgi:septal ring factor EnvC (AmiA/AmiB activator)
VCVLLAHRDAALQQQSALVASLAEQRGAAAELQAQLQSTTQQASQLDQLREQLQQELAAARQQLLELGAAQDGLRAQVGIFATQNPTLTLQATLCTWLWLQCALHAAPSHSA